LTIIQIAWEKARSAFVINKNLVFIVFVCLFFIYAAFL
jgi:hypothetical protein